MKIRKVRVCTGGAQTLNDQTVTAGRKDGVSQRRIAVSVEGVNCCASSEQCVHYLNSLSLCSEMQRCPPKGIDHVGIRVFCQELATARAVSLNRGIMQFGAPKRVGRS
jgi:hypothetical protein